MVLNGRRSIATANNNYVKRLVQDANAHPSDPLRQLRVLQMLNRIHPSLVIQRVEEVQFTMSQEAQKEYMKALVNADRMDTIDLNMFLARIQSTGLAGFAVKQPQNNLQKNVSIQQAANESGYRAWAAFATLAWASIVGMSLLTFWNEEGWKEEHTMTSGLLRGLELHLDFTNRSVGSSSKNNEKNMKEPNQDGS